MGSPEFALPTLRLLVEHYPVVGVVTQPDRPAGRGKALTPPPVKLLAAEFGIEVIQPERLRQPEAFERLQAWKPDVIVVTAFGQILRPNILEMPPHGCINVHASLLPRWRGAAPIQAAILHGDKGTGVTIMKMDAGVDTGPILEQLEETILPDDTAGTLAARLAQAGAELLVATLPGILAGEISPQPQPDQGATYAGLIRKNDAKLDLNQPAERLERQVRAFNPAPGAFVYWQGNILKVHRCRAIETRDAIQGLTGILDGMPALGTGGGWLVLETVQPAGKRAIAGDVFLRGERRWGAPAVCE
ncbi:MAG: methionyl-tRNA formyltransferase [Anaerolineaceae bacterium]|nr:methionyl-tRNA formyltransferase [Anaerolineaceae bacterium]